ncbi:zinc ABC transporter substrate-binding protein [Peribacillus frigoritolerans]|nr:zinc ABC transporter substrate-binding protein [Peribacillus frigoritolerans]MDF2000570.1 zinc ABC transporter substrate-binding protein [Peribacillus frigoritolerans]
MEIFVAKCTLVDYALVEMKPDQKEYFEQNYMALKKELENVNSSFKEMVEKSPRKTFIVPHSAYGYLKQIGICGLSPSSEPSQKQLEEIIMKAQEENI